MIFWVLDGSTPECAEESARFLHGQIPSLKKQDVIALWNKRDLDSSPATLPELPGGVDTLSISARTGKGLEDLLERFSEKVWGGAPDSGNAESLCEVSARHEVLLREGLSFVRAASGGIQREEWELAATDLREALACLGTVTGEEVSGDVLSGIFRNFCIGK